MPELPEVQTFVTDLRPQLVGRRIESVAVHWPRTIAAPDVATFVERLPGRRIMDLTRRGKFLLGWLDSGEVLAIHLRMTGRLEIVPCASPVMAGTHVRATFWLSGDECLVFSDMRKFGRIWLAADVNQVIGDLGPEPLAWDFTPELLAERIRGRRAAIKALLLNQTVVAGLGNIYADEALFLACIHPLRLGTDLTSVETTRLHEAIRQVLGEAIGERGTTLRDYRPPYGLEAAYQHHLRVYQQTDRPCPRCGSPIRRIRVTQRSTHFCPQCQI